MIKFKQLKNAGHKAFLWLESQDRQSFVTLQVHLGPALQPWEETRHRFRQPAHHHARGEERRPRQHTDHREQAARRAGPSRLRRRALRAVQACARAAAVDQIPPSPPAVDSAMSNFPPLAKQVPPSRAAAETEKDAAIMTFPPPIFLEVLQGLPTEMVVLFNPPPP